MSEDDTVETFGDVKAVMESFRLPRALEYVRSEPGGALLCPTCGQVEPDGHDRTDRMFHVAEVRIRTLDRSPERFKWTSVELHRGMSADTMRDILRAAADSLLTEDE